MHRVLALLSVTFFLTSCVMFNSVDIGDLFEDKIKLKFVGGKKDADASIAILPLHGVIAGSQSRYSMSSGISPVYVEKALAKLSQQEKLQALILDINSPGGSAAASEEIMAQILNFKKQKQIPVIAYYGDMAASGGYYVSQAADQIIANPNSVTGSIGVVLMFPRIDRFLKNKLDIEMITFKSGKFKDSGSMFRQMRQEERDYWQKLTLMYYDRFIEVVAQRRKIPEAKVREISQGQVMHPKYALENKLIDKIGTMDVAVTTATQLVTPSDLKILRVASSDPVQLTPSSVDVNLPFGISNTPAQALGYNGAAWYIFQ